MQSYISHNVSGRAFKGPATLAMLPFLTNVLCHNFLWVRVMSVKVYIFGKEINRRNYLWPQNLKKIKKSVARFMSEHGVY